MPYLECRKIRNTKFHTQSLTAKCAPRAESSIHSFAFWRFFPDVSPRAKFSQFSNRRQCSAVFKSRRQRWTQFEFGSTTVRSAGVLMGGIARDLVCPRARRTAGGQVWPGGCRVARCAPKSENYSKEFYPRRR